MNQESNAYLTVALGHEKFAIAVEHVQEVVELGAVTKVPHAPEYMLGIINLRGRVLPLMDTRIKLGLPPTEFTKKSRVMVLDLQTGEKNLQLGAVVDAAREVIEIRANDIQEAPEFEDLRSKPVTGVVNDNGHITLIMDIEKVFTAEDTLVINQSVPS